ncbi:MAG: hypothetical protein EXR67_04220 [Dehalococcoidia bacterium]|nr:hypothetical protein [Dehalococcoidia bacterium]
MADEVVLSQGAIENRKLMSITYKGVGQRVIEPYIIYERKGSGTWLDAYQLGGHSESGEPEGWKQFHLQEINTVQVLDEVFAPRPTYNIDNRRKYERIITAVERVA